MILNFPIDRRLNIYRRLLFTIWQSTERINCTELSRDTGLEMFKTIVSFCNDRSQTLLLLIHEHHMKCLDIIQIDKNSFVFIFEGMTIINLLTIHRSVEVCHSEKLSGCIHEYGSWEIHAKFVSRPENPC